MNYSALLFLETMIQLGNSVFFVMVTVAFSRTFRVSGFSRTFRVSNTCEVIHQRLKNQFKKFAENRIEWIENPQAIVRGE